MKNVLFVCTHNAGRSQMSQTFFASATAGTGLEGRSAGTRPAARVDPTVVEAMSELGHDISGNEPAPLTAELSEWADTFVTMGCGDACPAIPGTPHIEWDLDDPKVGPSKRSGRSGTRFAGWWPGSWPNCPARALNGAHASGE